MKSIVLLFLLVGISTAHAQTRPLDSWVGGQKVVTSTWDTTVVTTRPAGWPVFIRLHSDSIGTGDTVYVAKDTDIGSTQLFRLRSGDTPIVIGPTILNKLLLKSSIGDTLKVRLMVY